MSGHKLYSLTHCLVVAVVVGSFSESSS